MLFDTHCHLNFEAFDGRVDQVIADAKKAGVNRILIPGTDIPTSKKAIEIAEKFEGVYVAVGIHPHHVFEIYSSSLNAKIPVFSSATPPRGPLAISQKQKSSLSILLTHPKVLAIGEVGIDRHVYQKTKHENYKVDEEFVELQKEFFLEQIKLAHKYKKALIIHNREAKKDVLEILNTCYLLLDTVSAVFHCCEPDSELLEFAKNHRMFIGVDGDVTYAQSKQEFIKTVPLEMLVLETDSPFLTPRLRRTSARQRNEPKNISLVAEFVAGLKGMSVEEVRKQTTENAKILYKVRP